MTAAKSFELTPHECETISRLCDVLVSRGLLGAVLAVLERHPYVTLDQLLAVERTTLVALARSEVAWTLEQRVRNYSEVGRLLGVDKRTAAACVKRWAHVLTRALWLAI